MKRKFLIIGLAMSGFAFSQDNCPNIEDVSWVLGDNNKKYVVSLLDSEIYSDELDVSVKRDTFIVNKNYPLYHLIDETEWEESCKDK
jgi:hypothetical protein|tara:strand:- start:429 stop:689 length:261 start_codon:yes stop_codon:yes gene_type:complete